MLFSISYEGINPSMLVLPYTRITSGFLSLVNSLDYYPFVLTTADWEKPTSLAIIEML